MDNACRYAGTDGQVQIRVSVHGSRVCLHRGRQSGPGIPEADRPRLGNVFSRGTEHGPVPSLGLAVGDSIVRSIGGRWHMGDSPLGGALIEVSWRHCQPRPARRAAGNGQQRRIVATAARASVSAEPR